MPFFTRRQPSGFGSAPKPSPVPSAPRKVPAPPPKPKTLFEQKKDWARSDFLSRTARTPFKLKSYYERKKMIEEVLPAKRFSTYVSEREVKTRLRELKKEEIFAKTYGEKQKAANLRKYLEKETGLKGKY